MANIFEKGRLKGEYEQIDSMGEGGNAVVFRIKKKETGEEFALKPLKEDYAKNTKKPEKRERFKKEIEVVNKLKGEISGILPIVDYEIDDENKIYWYTMPIASEINEELKKREYDFRFIISGIIDLAETLSKLHENGRSHRDIKPENIYYYDNRFYIGDFGLVSFLDDEVSFTESCALGAYSTMAPEMRRDPHISDGKKADVYSLAKTLWIMLTKKGKGFDGVYDFRDKKIGLRYDSVVSKIHIVELEELLHEVTDNDPDKRPTMHEFKNRLQLWIDMNPDDFYSAEIQNSEWRFINNYLFGDNLIYVPDTAEWNDKKQICEILSLISSLPAFNHMLYMKGGLDFTGIEDANEEGCLYLYEDFAINVIKPYKLIYCNFSEDPRWNYFLLELDELHPIFEYETENELCYEVLVEDLPGHYVSAQYSQYGVYDYESGNKFPDGWKEVRRCIKGKFLLCLKFGPYNNIHSTYDGRHTQCSAEQFRKYISALICVSRLCRDNGYNEKTVLNSKKISKNPFESEEIEYIENTNQEYKIKNKNFVKEHYKEWCFKEQIINFDFSKLSHIKFWISYDKSGFSFDIFGCSESFKNKTVLCKDGFFKSGCNEEEILFFNNYDEVYKTKENIKKEMLNICESHGINFDEDNLHLIIKHEFMNIAPKHLFTKDEIEELMRNADDRHHNVLVINADGYAEIIQDDINKGNYYPVSHESWNAGNKYVGKYSKLLSLDDDYISSLQGWLLFLNTHKHVYIDYVHENKNEDELIKQIKEFYE